MPIEELQTCINEKSDTLSLQYSGEDPADLIAEVAQALKAGHLTNVTSLDLGGSAIAKEHIEMLADLVFPHMPQLQDLDFRHNDLETEGAVLLRPALEKYCRNLTALDVSENRLRDVGAREIAGVLMALPNMKSIRLGSNQLTAKCVPSIVAGLRKAQSLTFLGLEFNGLGDQGVIDLLNGIRGHCVNLAHINLSDLCLTDDAVTRGIVPYIQASKRAQRLQQIDLSVNKIGAIGAVALAVAFRTTQVLDTVDLGCNPIGEAGNVAIAEALSNPRCSVTHIDLSATEMTPTAFEALRVAVSRNPRIMKLRTGSNDQITGEMHSQIQDLLAVRSASAISAAPVSDFSGSTMTYLALGSAVVAVALYGVWRVTRR